MNDKMKPSEDDTVDLKIPEALLKRVETYCQSIGITPYEFLIDAISEKLAFVHKEKRRKPRL